MNLITRENLKIQNPSTTTAREMLHIDYDEPDRWSLNYAGNIYLAALQDIESLRESLEEIRGKALSAISYVESANYTERANQAREWVNKAIDDALDSE